MTHKGGKYAIVVRPRQYNSEYIGISRQEYEHYWGAMKQVHSWLRLELAFDNLISEYEELEAEILRITVADVVRTRPDYWESFMLDRQKVLRKIYCVLSLCGTYLDCGGSLRQLDTHIPDLSDRFTGCRNAIRETAGSSQLMYALRNVLVHQLTTPISISLPSHLDYQNDGVLTTIHLNIDKHELLQDRETARYKGLKGFIDNLGAEGLDVKFHLRHYISEIMTQHCRFRNEIEARLEEIVAMIEEVGAAAEPPGRNEVWVAQVDGDNEIVQHVTIFDEPIKLIRQLVARNRRSHDLSRAVVLTADASYMERWRASRPPIVTTFARPGA